MRARRASQQATIGETAGPGQQVDRSGRIVPNLGDVQYIDRNGKQQIRIDEESLQVISQSPRRIAARTKPSDVQAVADAGSASRDLLTALEAGLASEVVDRTLADAALDARVDVLEAAPSGGATITQATIDFGTTAVREKDFTIVDAAVVAPTYKILVGVALDADTAENPGTEETLVMAARAGTGQFTLRVRVAEGGAMRGTLKVNYQVAA